MMKRVYWLLILIVLFGAVLRFFYLGKTPVSMEWDEVALGYDAYSILKTGRDQFGQFLPINFRSLDDWKPPLYVYSAIPSIAVLGLTNFATRFPSALYGTIAIVLTFILTKEILGKRSQKEKNTIALLASFFLSISPWHLQFSRASFETNISVTVVIASILFFLRGVRGHMRSYLLSAVLFGLALFSYHSTRVVTPLLLISLFLIYRNRLPKKKYVLSFLGIYTFFWLIFLPIVFNRDAQIRFIVTNSLKIAENQAASAQEILKDLQLGPDALFAGRIFYNRRLSVFNYENAKTLSKNYLSHFSFEFLFEKGDAPLHHAPGFGMMYFFDVLFLSFGIYYFLRVYQNRESLILPIWLLLAPIPAAVTWQAPHSVRAEIILPTLQIFCALGLYSVLQKIRNEWALLEKLVIVLLTFVFIFGVGKYLHQYYFRTNIELSKNWLYGRKEAVEMTENLKQKYDRVLVSMNVDMPYIFWLYYTKYSPVTYLKTGGTVSGGFADERNKFDKYEFRNFDYNLLPTSERLLLVGIPKDFPQNAQILSTIYYLDGSPALLIGQNRH